MIRMLNVFLLNMMVIIILFSNASSHAQKNPLQMKKENLSSTPSATISLDDVEKDIAMQQLETALQKLSALDPLIVTDAERARLEKNRGLIALQRQEFEKATVYLEKSVQFFSTEDKTWLLLSMAYDAINQDDRALNAIERGLKKCVHSSFLLHEQGMMLLEKKRYEEALRSLLQAHKISPQDVDIRLDLAFAYITQEQYASAHEHAMYVLEQQKNADTYYVVALAEQGLKQQKKALVYVARALEYDPMHTPSLFLAAKLWETQGDYIKTFDYLNALFKIEPEHEQGQKLLVLVISKIQKIDTKLERSIKQMMSLLRGNASLYNQLIELLKK